MCIFFYFIKYIFFFITGSHSLTTASIVEVGKPLESGCQSHRSQDVVGYPELLFYLPVCVLTLGPVLARCKTVFVGGGMAPMGIQHIHTGKYLKTPRVTR